VSEVFLPPILRYPSGETFLQSFPSSTSVSLIVVGEDKVKRVTHSP